MYTANKLETPALDEIKNKNGYTKLDLCILGSIFERYSDLSIEEAEEAAAELLKLREESVFLNDYEKVTLYVCDECETISNTAGICIICNESLQEKDYYAKEE